MKVERLNLMHFRNIPSLTITPCEGVNIFFGDNAQGKTNLIEALWLMTGAKSFRRVPNEREYIQFGEESARMELEFYNEGRTQSIELEIGEKKTAALNGIKQESASALAGNFTAVVFAPAHMSLIRSGPAQRRKFLDACLCQISPKFIKTLSDYNRSLTQRNALLKDVRHASELLDMLDVWDQSIARLSALIIRMRTKLVERLNTCAGGIYNGFSSSQEQLRLAYRCSLGFDYRLEDDLSQVCGEIYNRMKYHLSDDIKYGITTLGAHRDDMEIHIDGKDARSFASQGQSRSAVLSLKLAESEILLESTGERPVILLDDVMSELDAARRDYILNHIQENQVFLTCCEKAYFERLKNGIIVEMSAGRLLS